MTASGAGRRVGVVLPDLSAIGAQRYVLGICKQLEERGFRCDYLLQAPRGAFLGEVDPAQVVSFMHRRLSRLRGVRTLESIARLAAHLRAARYDVIFSVTPFFNRVLCALKAARVFSGRLVIEEHGYPPLYLATSDGMTRPEAAAYRNSFFLYRHADVIRVISEGIRDHYRERGLTGNVVLFPNLTDLRRVEALGREPPDLRLAQGVRNVVSFGRLTVQKRVDFLLEAFAVLREGTDARLWLIGDGDQRASLEETASRLGLEGQVTFLGYRENPYPLLAQGDAFVLTSAWEGAPQVIVEAMTLGVPVVSLDCLTGPAEMLGAGSERGWLVPRGAAPAAFAGALRDALSQREESARRAAEAGRFARQTYDLHARIDEYVARFFEG